MRTHLQLGINPIIVKELRSRMREARAFITLTGVLLLMGVASYLIYRMALATARYSSTPISPQIGQSLFIALAVLELLMVCAITPAVTAGAISSEQEKQTYEMLLATPLRPASILWGKLVSALSYVFLLIFAAIPMASLIFIFGGVAPRDMVKALVVLVTVAVFLGVLGMFSSAWLKRTPRATVISYLVVLLLLIGTLFVFVAVGVIRQSEPPRWILVLNPMSALFSALSTTASPDGSYMGPLWFFGAFLGGDMRAFSGATLSQTGIPRPLYHYTLPLYGAITLVLYMLATRLVRPARRWRISRREAALALGILLVYLGALGLAYWSTAGRYENVSALFASPPQPEMIREAVMVERAVAVAGLPALQPVEQITESDQAEIYAAAARQVYLLEHVSGPDIFPVVYLIRNTDDGSCDPGTPQAPSQTLSDEVQREARAHLEDMQVEFRWVDSPEEAAMQTEKDGLQGRAVTITFGNLHLQEDHSVLLPLHFSFGDSFAQSKTYLMGQLNGDWQALDIKGVVCPGDPPPPN